MAQDHTNEPRTLAERAFELAKRYEKKCTGCAQSTLAGVLDTLDVESPDAFRAASGLADGVGLTGDGSCGALTGAVLAIGMLCGRTREEFREPLAAMKSYDLARDLHADFIERYGTCRCHDIQKRLMGRCFNLRDEKDLAAAFEGGMLDHCSTVVGNSARKTIELLLAAGVQPTPARDS